MAQWPATVTISSPLEPFLFLVEAFIPGVVVVRVVHTGCGNRKSLGSQWLHVFSGSLLIQSGSKIKAIVKIKWIKLSRVPTTTSPSTLSALSMFFITTLNEVRMRSQAPARSPSGRGITDPTFNILCSFIWLWKGRSLMGEEQTSTLGPDTPWSKSGCSEKKTDFTNVSVS